MSDRYPKLDPLIKTEPVLTLPMERKGKKCHCGLEQALNLLLYPLTKSKKGSDQQGSEFMPPPPS